MRRLGIVALAVCEALCVAAAASFVLTNVWKDDEK
jgi:hypothetical protein